MSKDKKTEDYEIGYGKPPESGKFKKGVSGNPSGRPKKPPEIGSAVMRELESPLRITVNGKEIVIKKREGVAKQLVNKSLSGHLASTRMCSFCSSKDSRGKQSSNGSSIGQQMILLTMSSRRSQTGT